jgi:hypothetical protein
MQFHSQKLKLHKNKLGLPIPLIPKAAKMDIRIRAAPAKPVRTCARMSVPGSFLDANRLQIGKKFNTLDGYE